MFGNPEQKQEFLPRCAKGEITAFLLTEPDVGSDPARLGTTAVLDGDDYVLNGVKLWTTNGVVADLLVVMAQVPDRGITAFVVEADAEDVGPVGPERGSAAVVAVTHLARDLLHAQARAVGDQRAFAQGERDCRSRDLQPIGDDLQGNAASAAGLYTRLPRSRRIARVPVIRHQLLLLKPRSRCIQPVLGQIVPHCLVPSHRIRRN